MLVVVFRVVGMAGERVVEEGRFLGVCWAYWGVAAVAADR